MRNLIFGVNAVYEALRMRGENVIQVVLVRGRTFHNLDRILELANRHQIPVVYKERRSFEQMLRAKHMHHQGIVAEIKKRVLTSLNDVLESLTQEDRKGIILVCDDINDPHNLGALIRSGACAGVDAVVIPKRGAAQVTPTVMKVSAGGTEHVPTCRVSNINNAIHQLKEAGFFVVGLAGEAEKSIYDADLRGKIALVIGNEERGLKRIVREKCDLLVCIPMGGQMNSLNASVAGGIGIFEVLRQKKNLDLS